MKEYIGIYALGLAILCLAGLLMSAVGFYRMKNRVWELEAGSIQMRDAIDKLKNPLPQVQVNPLTGRPHRGLIEYTEPAIK